MIHGRDASGMSDGEIFALIGKLERAIETAVRKQFGVNDEA